MRSKTRRVAIVSLLAPAAGLTLAGSWSAYLGLSVRDHLQATRDALVLLRASDPGRLAGTLADARWHASEARRLTSGPDWSLLAHAPVVGDGATTIRGLAETVAELTTALADVHRATAQLIMDVEPATDDRPAADDRPSMADVRQLLAVLDSAAPVLDSAADRVAAARSRLSGTPAHTGVSAVDEARSTALREVDRLGGWLGAAADAATLVPPMLGHDGPRRYFLAFQTNAEARGTGGLVGAFGILKAGRGQLDIERLSANNRLSPSSDPVADYGPEFRSRYGPSALSLLSNSNLSPHFPYAANTWTSLWERQTGQQLDGALATDPVGLSYLLRLIGPVTLPSGETVTAENVIGLTEQEAYVRYPNPDERKKFLITIAGAVSEALTRSRPDPVTLLSTLSQLAEERRIQVWSRRDTEEQRLETTPLSGVLPEKPGPFAGLVINNSGGNKLDYYLKRSLRYELASCRPDGQRVTKVRVRLTNDVPHRKLPTYVTSRLDHPDRPRAVGSNLLWVSMYTGAGAQNGGVRINGKLVKVVKEVERSHPVYSTMLELAPGQSKTLEYLLLEPASTAPPLVPVQPLAHPQQTRIMQDRTGCGPESQMIDSEG
ncbi:DUF4012 domain-containing protein [Nonomuraea guangzhouensis]|uniref:DUF4012 domain-containing protein n=1 Tax=Nonomuraea guangzhouensis TaxID=1291555 RepID=A0ABW4G066_9ACTN|nr:DUF4012 domain-containing protein [Nonomuraea guangzhouensis]